MPISIRHVETRIRHIIDQDSPMPWRSLATPLYCLSVMNQIGVQLRAHGYQIGWLKKRRLACIVVSIGNLTVGGTGKTPMTVYMARLCQHLGYSCVIVCRGYKGRASKQGGVVSDGQTIHMQYEDAGDEPLMMARQLSGVPVIIGRDRYQAGYLAIRRFDPDVILLDDGFQHLRLARDINILLCDYVRPLGNGHLLPRGPLREPPRALKRADIHLLTRCDAQTGRKQDAARQTIDRIREDRPLFKTIHRPVIRAFISKGKTVLDHLSEPPSNLMHPTANQTVLAFCGLAHNIHFKQTLTQMGWKQVEFLEFPDHHAYTPNDINQIQNAAATHNTQLIITSDKDHARLDPEITWPADLVVLGVDIQFETDQTRFDNCIAKRLRELKESSSVD